MIDKIMDKLINMPWDNGKLCVSKSGRFIEHENGVPFFWMGDTAWLLFSKLDRSEAELYLRDRREKGFNVVQVMILHEIEEKNIYGNAALIDNMIDQPNVSSNAQGYWENMDYVIDKAAENGIYLGLVPVWGSIVDAGYVDVPKIKEYGRWLAERYKKKSNIIWLIGGDTKGNIHREIWTELAEAIKSIDHNHLMTFHPFGRTQSSSWFHSESWLDFNMIQSGHRRYNQHMKEEEDDENIWIGQDNWRYIEEDYNKVPHKPTIDGESSYEGIPQGLHDPSEPYWTNDDCRRYAYWSVFAGAFGYTYGNNAVMQMHKPGSEAGTFGVKKYWDEAINDPGANEMKYLKEIMLSVPFFDRVPDQTVIHGDIGDRYERILATRGKDYIFVYDYVGRSFEIVMGKISGEKVEAWWYSPRNGEIDYIGEFINSGVKEFNPPGDKKEGNDWVLVVNDSSAEYFSN